MTNLTLTKKKEPKTSTIKDLLTNLKAVMVSDSTLATLLDFERVLSELDLYAFLNWKDGELVEGPTNEKYFVTCKFMWPYDNMPDPRGAERLLGYDCVITYEKTTLDTPVEVDSPEDYKGGSKMPKLASAPVWIVSITIPRKLINDIRLSVLDIEDEVLNREEVEYASDTGEDEDEGKEEGGEDGAPEEYSVETPEELPK